MGKSSILHRLIISCVAVWTMVLALDVSCFADTLKAQKGTALIIGQTNYLNLTPLPNPASDARALDEILRALGFETTVVTDLNQRKLARAIANFAEDAEGSDVAVVYYSGHGIEAGGDNWLIPVDSDVSSLNEADRKLVSLSGLVAELSSRVPLIIVFLDACRSNPFPPGSTFVQANGSAFPVSQTGLGGARGVSESVVAGSPDRGLGTLIGFAAEPGQAALDGPAGSNSPYAAALHRHLSAMAGAEIGVVMRMVTQEVYLKTKGQQRPWVNETLTRLVYLGKSAQPPADDEAHILTERRQLLLSITDLSAGQRWQVESAARTAGVPMDALYGLLRSLGSAIPSGSDELEKLLNSEAERVKDLLSSHRALESGDVEILRLEALAGRALEDGALDAYVAFWEQAKTRFLAISENLDATEERLRARRLEGGEVLAGTAAAHELKANYLPAAGNYALAYAQVAKWDDAKAWEYKRREADAWLFQGDEKGDNAALTKAIATFGEALSIAPRETAPARWAWTMNNLGNALLISGTRGADTRDIDRAITAYLAALEERPRHKAPKLWAKTQNNLAIAYADLAERSGDSALLDRAIESYRAALTETSRSEEPLEWAAMMNNLGDALTAKGGDNLEAAVAAHRAALTERPRERLPLLWAASQQNIGNALHALGQARGDGKIILEGIAAIEMALQVVQRAGLPLRWAGLQYNLGNAYGHLGELETGTANLLTSVAFYRAALAEESFERSPLSWAKTQYMLGQQLWQLGERTSDPLSMKQSVQATRKSLRFYTRTKNPADWAITVYFLGIRQHRLGNLTQDTAAMTEAVELLHQSLEFYTRQRDPKEWAETRASYADALTDLGFSAGRVEQLKDAFAAYESLLAVQTKVDMPVAWASVQMRMGVALFYVSLLQNIAAPALEGRKHLAAAAEVFAAEGKPKSAAAATSIIANVDNFIGKLPP